MANSLYETHLQRIMLFDVFIKTNTGIHAVQVNEHNYHNPLQSQPIESHRQRELALKLVGQVNFSLQIKFIARTGYVDINATLCHILWYIVPSFFWWFRLQLLMIRKSLESVAWILLKKTQRVSSELKDFMNCLRKPCLYCCKVTNWWWMSWRFLLLWENGPQLIL